MAFVAGDKFGPYEVISLVGAGGMGEVYRARDPRLNRDVAIKTSTAVFSDRFEREARAVAALNHPNVCTLYDVGPDYLVMEFVEGADLKGPLPLDDALRVARQIADALDAAHTRGIIHRDLKPGNIKVTPDGTVKVLDFGLAKLADDNDPRTGASAASGHALSQSPTMTLAATQAGIILGTAAYMAPEQARGKAVDKRADIWAFGVVLYELLTGESLFQGEDVSDSLAAVIRKDPDLTRMPIEVRRLLQACLEKDPKNRLRDIGDVWRLLDTPQKDTTKRVGPGSVLPWVAAAVAIAGAGALAFIHFRETAPESPLVRFQIPAPEKTTLEDLPPVISPDGRRLAFVARGEDGQARLWIRDFSSVESRKLTGTDAVVPPGPFWSPDGRNIGFATLGGAVKKIAVSGGAPVTITDSTSGFGGGAWNRDGDILIGSPRGVQRISGGAVSLITHTDESKETAHAFPQFLPDGNHFIYLAGGAIYLSSLSGNTAERLIESPSRAVYAPPLESGHLGHLLYVRESSLMAQPLDSNTFHPVGDAFPVEEQVGTAFGDLLGFFSVSPSGALAYRVGSGVGAHQLTWFDREGRPLGTVGPAGRYADVAVSRDGMQIVVGQDGQYAAPHLWLINTTDGVPNLLTSSSGNDASPVWSPDGRRLAFSSDRDRVYGEFNAYVKDLNGTGKEEKILNTARMRDWSRDGKYLLYNARAQGGVQLWYAPVDGERKPVPFPHAPRSNEAQGQFAPNPEGAGTPPRWIAYTSNETGENEIYVQSFPPGGARPVRISSDGGMSPRWRADGRELFYISRDDRLIAVDIKAGLTVEHGPPRELFKARIRSRGRDAYAFNYDVSPDGKRFLIVSRPASADGASPPMSVVTNWLAGVKK